MRLVTLNGLSYEPRTCKKHEGVTVEHKTPVCPMCQLVQDMKDAKSLNERATRMMERAIDVAEILREQLALRPADNTGKTGKVYLDEQFPDGRLFKDDEP